MKKPAVDSFKEVLRASAESQDPKIKPFEDLANLSLARTFLMRPFDDQNTAANASLVSSFAAGDSSVIAVVGHVSSDATLQGIANYGPAQLALIAPVPAMGSSSERSRAVAD